MSSLIRSVFLLYLISNLERAKINFKNKQAKAFFFLYKLSQVSVIALPDYQLLRQVLENAILHPIIF